MSVLFITEAYLKANTEVNDNVDPKLITPAITEAQDIDLQDLLGSALYTDLKTKVASDADLSGFASYKTLMDGYIIPALKYYTLYRLLMPMTVKLMNKSVMTRTSDNANSISIDDVYKLEERYLNKAQWYGRRLVNYLCDNTTTYTLYNSYTSNNSTIHPNQSSFAGGMFLEINNNDGFTEKFTKD